jgi:hypothetical protein
MNEPMPATDILGVESGFKIRGLRWIIVGLIFFATLINYRSADDLGAGSCNYKGPNLSNTESVASQPGPPSCNHHQPLSGKLYDRI